MKVLVIQGALTAYFRLLLEKLNGQDGLTVALVIPQTGGITAGAGVKTDTASTTFKTYPLPEYKAWYGKAFFRGFEHVTLDFLPDVILCGYPYFIYFLFNKSLYRRLRDRHIRFVYRDIPWNIPFYGKAAQYFAANQSRTESGFESQGKGFIPLLRFLVLTEVRKRYLKLADAHLYYTDEARELIKSYGVDSRRIFISANSPDTDILLHVRDELLASEDPPVLDPFRLIHVGRLVRWKRVDLILEAVAILLPQVPEIELYIAGYGPEEENLHEQAANLRISERVHFLDGVYDPIILGRYLLSAGVYVLAGMGGLSINDAMCFAKPVVCAEADGTERRLVREGYNGLYFESGNSASLAEKLMTLLGDTQKLRLYGDRSLNIIKNEVNIHTVLQEYRAAFNFAVAS